MKIGLGLYRESLTPENFRFARQAGATHIVAHLTNYFRGRDPSLSAGTAVDGWGDCSDDRLWSYEELAALVDVRPRQRASSLPRSRTSRRASGPTSCSTAPTRDVQMDGLKQLVRDAGRAGIPCIGYNFSIAGVWGWSRGPVRARRSDVGRLRPVGHRSRPAAAGRRGLEHALPGRRAPARPLNGRRAKSCGTGSARFLRELVPVAEEAGVVLAAHPDDPPAEALRGAARLVNRPEKYDRLLDIVDLPANGLELCLGSLQEMPGSATIYEDVRRFARRGRIGYIHFRNVRGKVPHYHETFVDEGDIDMAEIVRILRDEGYARRAHPRPHARR